MLPRLNRRRACFLVGALALACGLIVGHAAILKLVAGGLVAAAPANALPWPGAETYVLVASGDSAELVAARLLVQGRGEQCLVFAEAPSRAEQLGVMPPSADVRTRELMSQGVASEQIAVLQRQPELLWEEQLALWMQARPGAKVLLLCDQFSSRRQQAAIDAAMSPELASRVALMPLPDRRFDETNWWKSRLGIRHFIGSYFALAAFYTFDDMAMPYHAPDQYEAWFLGDLRLET